MGNQLMKFEIAEDKLKMEIDIEDLVFLFNESPNNYGRTIKTGKELEFVQYVVNLLQDVHPEHNDIRWGVPLEEIFEEIFCGDENFCEYKDDE